MLKMKENKIKYLKFIIVPWMVIWNLSFFCSPNVPWLKKKKIINRFYSDNARIVSFFGVCPKFWSFCCSAVNSLTVIVLFSIKCPKIDSKLHKRNFNFNLQNLYLNFLLQKYSRMRTVKILHRLGLVRFI